jgi:hypothetical protein
LKTDVFKYKGGNEMRRSIFLSFIVLTALFNLWTVVHAQTSFVTPLTVGPTNPVNGFPTYFGDTNGRAVELCLDPVFCLFDPVDPANPFSVQVGFGPEAFWWSADAIIDNGTISAILVLAVEAAWNNEEPEDGEQFPFTRLRIRADVPAPGTYIITHPYGTETFVVTSVGPGREINMSRDIPVVGVHPVNETIHNGAVGPLLIAENPAPPAGFLGDPNILQTVTGSPTGNNFFRIQAAGVNLGAGAGNPVQTNEFSVQGKVFSGVFGTPVTVHRSTYARVNPGQVDVFATSAPTATVNVSGIGASPIPMIGNGAGSFFVSIPVPTNVIPATVSVNATNPGNSPTTIISPLVDVVTITRADYILATGTLVVNASSSDQASPPTLTAVGIGTLVAGALTTTLPIPPATVTVQSSAGGSDTEPVNIIRAPTFSISGRIRGFGVSVEGITVNITGPVNASAVTDASGVFSVAGLINGTYTVTPAGPSRFFPASRTVTISGANMVNQNFRVLTYDKVKPLRGRFYQDTKTAHSSYTGMGCF